MPHISNSPAITSARSPRGVLLFCLARPAIVGNGPASFRQACNVGAEGSKRADASYRPDNRGGPYLVGAIWLRRAQSKIRQQSCHATHII
jgi:hypothetical protein